MKKGFRGQKLTNITRVRQLWAEVAGWPWHVDAWLVRHTWWKETPDDANHVRKRKAFFIVKLCHLTIRFTHSKAEKFMVLTYIQELGESPEELSRRSCQTLLFVGLIVVRTVILHICLQCWLHVDIVCLRWQQVLRVIQGLPGCIEPAHLLPLSLGSVGLLLLWPLLLSALPLWAALVSRVRAQARDWELVCGARVIGLDLSWFDLVSHLKVIAGK